MDARNNFAMQQVFDLARDADPEGIRTVGVITKCDAVLEGDEETVRIIIPTVSKEFIFASFKIF